MFLINIITKNEKKMINGASTKDIIQLLLVVIFIVILSGEIARKFGESVAAALCK